MLKSFHMRGYVIEFGTLKNYLFVNHKYIIIANSKSEFQSYISRLKKSIIDLGHIFVDSTVVESESEHNGINLLNGIYSHSGYLLFQDCTDKLHSNFQELFETA